jgi:ERCC4-type nuclease
MNIVVDVREATLYDHLTNLLANTQVSNIQILSKPLVLGDILIEDEQTHTTLVLYERKSLTDLLASIRDGRYAEQSHRLVHASNIPPHNIAYVIEGMYSQLHNPGDKQKCISAITTMFYYKGFSVFRTCSIMETAELIFGMAKKIHSDNPAITHKVENTSTPTPSAYCEVVHKVKKENITPQNISEIILCSIPGISSTSAIEIMKHYTSFSNFMEELKTRPEKLNDIYLTTNGKKRKLGKNIIENIRAFLA